MPLQPPHPPRPRPRFVRVSGGARVRYARAAMGFRAAPQTPLLRRAAPAAAFALAFALTAGLAQPGARAAGTGGAYGGVSLSGLYLAGRHAQIARDTRSAADFLLDALDMSPKEPALLRRAFVVLAAGGRMDEAFGVAERLQEIQPDALLTHYILWLRGAKAGDWAEALEHLEGAPDDGIRRYMKPVLTAWALAGEGRVEDALAALENLRNSLDAGALSGLAAAQILDFSGRLDEAVEKYRAVAETPGGLSMRLARMLGSALERAGDRDGAQKIYEQFLDENPGSELLDPAVLRFLKGDPPEIVTQSPQEGAAEALFSISGALRRQRAAETALVLSRMALFLQPDLDAARVLTGEILDSMNRHAEANEVYAGITAESPLRGRADLRRAGNLDLMGDTAGAIAELEAIAQGRPDDPAPLVNMGNVLRRSERFEDAVAAYNRAFERVPNLQSRHWSMLYARGIALERSGRWPEAETDFLRALEFQPDQPYVLNYLGYTWVDRGEHVVRSKEMIQKAVELRPEDGYIVDSLGWAHYRLGEYKDAADQLERAVELRPRDPVINDHLGDAFWKVGRLFEARFQWRRALSLEPEVELEAQLRAKLEGGLEAAQNIQPAGETDAETDAAPGAGDPQYPEADAAGEDG